MNSPYRFALRITMLAATLLVFSVAGFSQTSGTATLNGSVGNAAQLSSGGSPTVTGTATGTAASTQSAQNSALTATLNLGDVSPNNANAVVKIVMPIQIRSNQTFKLNVQRTAGPNILAAGAGGGSSIAAGDVGFGLVNVRQSGATGALLTATAVSGTTASGSFGNDPSTATVNADGIPTYATTLNNLSTATTTQVASGPRISNGGGLNSPNNAILIDVVFAVVPQFFTPVASFQEVLTFSLVSP